MTKGRMNIWRASASEPFRNRLKNIQRCLDFARHDKGMVERGGDDLLQPDEYFARVGAKQ